jgi:hypothetical protein
MPVAMELLGNESELRREIVMHEKDIAHVHFLPNAPAACDRFPSVDRG